MKLNSLNINFEQLETVAGEAVKTLENSNRADAKDGSRQLKKRLPNSNQILFGILKMAK